MTDLRIDVNPDRKDLLMNIRDLGRRSARRLTAVLATIGLLGAGALGTIVAVNGPSSSSGGGTSSSASSSTSTSTSTSTNVGPGTGSASNGTSTGS